MRAIVKSKADVGAEMVDMEIPTIGEEEVLVKVKATSICGTDVHIYNWDHWAQSRIQNLPQVLGHEFCGEVVEIGRGVKAIQPGDMVSAETHIPCRACKQCLTGQMHLCSNLTILGVDRNGCFAEYVAIPEVVAWKNPPELPCEIGSVQEPLGNAVYCSLAEPVTGKFVVIFGDGPTGLFAVAVTKVAGAAQVFSIGLNSIRLEIAKKLGADYVLNAKEDNVEEIIFKETGGLGADVVLEMAGSPQAIQQGLKLVRKGGRFSAFGITSEENITLDYNNGIVFKGATILGINGREMFETWYILSNLLKYKKLDITPVITHKFSLEDFQKGFELMKEQKCGKVVLLP